MRNIISLVLAKTRSFLQRYEINWAVIYGALNAGFGFVAAPVSAWFMIRFFSDVVQGYYYTFNSVLGLQLLFEAGFSSVIIQFASHEWARLAIGQDRQVCGDPIALARLRSLFKLALRWYAVISILVLIFLGVGGSFFFLQKDQHGVEWFMPWCLLCALTGVSLCLAPVWAVLEGCNQVSHVYWFRFIRTILSRGVFWGALFLGLNLWTAVVVELVALAYSGVFLWTRYRTFLHSLLVGSDSKAHIDWLLEIWPMQWRIGLSFASGYFVFSFFVPVLFQYHGPVVAGQMGMTWSIVGLVSTVSTAWVAPKAPVFGMLISQNKYKELNSLFWRLTKIVFFLTAGVALILWCVVATLNYVHHPWASRFLSPLPTGLFLAAQVLTAVSFPASAYLRAHKKEPLFWVSVTAGGLIMISNLVLGRYFSAMGMAAGYLFMAILIIPVVFIIWNNCRQQWHLIDLSQNEHA